MILAWLTRPACRPVRRRASARPYRALARHPARHRSRPVRPLPTRCWPSASRPGPVCRPRSGAGVRQVGILPARAPWQRVSRGLVADPFSRPSRADPTAENGLPRAGVGQGGPIWEAPACRVDLRPRSVRSVQSGLRPGQDVADWDPLARVPWTVLGVHGVRLTQIGTWRRPSDGAKVRLRWGCTKKGHRREPEGAGDWSAATGPTASARTAALVLPNLNPQAELARTCIHSSFLFLT
jgi:hypothetical protein